MTTNFPLRLAALALCAAILVGTLAACRGNANNQTTTSTATTTVTTAATSDTGIPGTGTSSSSAAGTHGTSSGSSSHSSGTAGPNTGSSGVAGSMLDGTAGDIDLSRAHVRFNDADYHVSKEEQLRRDEIGKQLLIIRNTVDTPENDGDAVGLPKGTRIYAIKDNTDYSAVAVEIDGMFYRAGKQAD